MLIYGKFCVWKKRIGQNKKWFKKPNTNVPTANAEPLNEADTNGQDEEVVVVEAQPIADGPPATLPDTFPDGNEFFGEL